MDNRQKILRQRAIKAAQKLEDDELQDDFDVIYFKVANEIYAIEAQSVSEIHNFVEPTLIPYTPSYILGIIHIRGRFVSLVTLIKFFKIQTQEESNPNSILLLSDNRMEFGVSVDEVLEHGKILKSEIGNVSENFDLPRADLIMGVTQNGVIVIDAKKFLADSALLIHQEVATLYKGKNDVK